MKGSTTLSALWLQNGFNYAVAGLVADAARDD